MNKIEELKLEINKYRFEMIDGNPKIVIDTVKVLDSEGKYIKFAKLEKLFPCISDYNVTFKNI